MVIQVFIQNEAGSNRKNYHNERTLEYLPTKLVSRVIRFHMDSSSGRPLPTVAALTVSLSQRGPCAQAILLSANRLA